MYMYCPVGGCLSKSKFGLHLFHFAAKDAATEAAIRAATESEKKET